MLRSNLSPKNHGGVVRLLPTIRDPDTQARGMQAGPWWGRFEAYRALQQWDAIAADWLLAGMPCPQLDIELTDRPSHHGGGADSATNARYRCEWLQHALRLCVKVPCHG